MIYSQISKWMIIIGIPIILGMDLWIHLEGGLTISERVWAWSGYGWGRLIPFGLGFLSCHLLLGKSDNG